LWFFLEPRFDEQNRTFEEVLLSNNLGINVVEERDSREAGEGVEGEIDGNVVNNALDDSDLSSDHLNPRDCEFGRVERGGLVGIGELVGWGKW